MANMNTGFLGGKDMTVPSAYSFDGTHTIHVWYIYLHLVDFYGKCRYMPPSVPSGSLFLGPSSSLWSYSRYIVGLKRFRGIGGISGVESCRKNQEKRHGNFLGGFMVDII